MAIHPIAKGRREQLVSHSSGPGPQQVSANHIQRTEVIIRGVGAWPGREQGGHAIGRDLIMTAPHILHRLPRLLAMVAAGFYDCIYGFPSRLGLPDLELELSPVLRAPPAPMLNTASLSRCPLACSHVTPD